MDNYFLSVCIRDIVVMDDNAHSPYSSVSSAFDNMPALAPMTSQDVRKASIHQKRNSRNFSKPRRHVSVSPTAGSSRRRNTKLHDFEQNRWSSFKTPKDAVIKAIAPPQRRPSDSDSPIKPERKLSFSDLNSAAERSIRRCSSLMERSPMITHQALSVDALQLILDSLDMLDVDDDSDSSNESTQCAYTVHQNRQKTYQQDGLLLKVRDVSME